MTQTLDSIVSSPRECASDWLILQSTALAEYARERSNTTALVFACLEARNAIEQLWFELLMVLHGGSMSKQLFEKCRHRSSGFLAAIGDAEPQYRKLSLFTSIAVSLDSRVPHQVIPWDLGRLKKYWHSISAYCHAQAHPGATTENANWIAGGHELISTIFAYFHQQMTHGATGIMKPETMTPDARSIWEDFAANKIDEDAVRIRLRIVQPLQQR